MQKKFTFIILMLLMTLPVMANDKVKINDIVWTRDNEKINLQIKYAGKAQIVPELKLDTGYLQVSLKNSSIWPKVEKKFSIKENKFDATVLAYQFDDTVVRVRTLLPYSMLGRENEVVLDDKNSMVTVQFPVDKVYAGIVPTEVPAEKTVKAEPVEKNKLDEAYLEKLLAESNEKNKVKKEPVTGVIKREDKVKTVASSVVKKPEEFSIYNYVIKFIVFLAIVLALFYGMVTLFKKGVVSRGKLGFLNNAKLVEVLSTTYIAPKKSMILVKAYNQVFLVGSTDNSLNLIAEVKDVPGLIKDGEKIVTGNNFDSTVDDMDNLNDLESKVKLKQDNEIFESSADKKERFSDQIKRKVKGLRPLQ